MKFKKIFLFLFLILISFIKAYNQVSPGELSSYHSHLEGISNCTKCHILGEKLSNAKCLDCHKELKSRILLKKGYHSSSEVNGKECIICHSEHNGLNFRIVNFDEKKFNHNLTGFILTGAHGKKECKDCHNSKKIQLQSLKNKKFTYLGLNPACKSCHEDYHQQTLSSECGNCHDANAFKPASKFYHTKAKFQLIGKHQNVDCIKCHKTEIKNGKKFQKFTGIQFQSCTNCHKDIHNNKFGQNCTECHNNESFTLLKTTNKFDHNKTDFKLGGKHESVNCKLCHKQKFTVPVNHKKCSDCHKDYHNAEFIKNGISPDCSDCHNHFGFQNSSYSIEKHNNTSFALQGAHMALPCFECHKKTEKWKFREIGNKCVDCHKNIHNNYISSKYFPENNCLKCHNNNKWNEINFDHNLTNFPLKGKHNLQTCRKCHFTESKDGITAQKFAGLQKNCNSCHQDIHYNQFDINGLTDCKRCHETDSWKAVNFNHNSTMFKLEGKHEKVECRKCHKPTTNNNKNYIHYKISTKCESCHS